MYHIYILSSISFVFSCNVTTIILIIINVHTYIYIHIHILMNVEDIQTLQSEYAGYSIYNYNIEISLTKATKTQIWRSFILSDFLKIHPK